MGRRWLAALGMLAFGGCEEIETTQTRCAVGERPGYFVPGTPAVLLGCARLGVSGKRVEFSRNVARIDGERHACINPAYRRGAFIPAMCKLGPLSRFAVRDARTPRGHGYVIWGTAGRASGVVARFPTGTARALIVGEPPLRLFVVELPRSAASGPVRVRPSGRSGPSRGPR
jgi:hypothetical protein